MFYERSSKGVMVRNVGLVIEDCMEEGFQQQYVTAPLLLMSATVRIDFYGIPFPDGDAISCAAGVAMMVMVMVMVTGFGAGVDFQ